MSFNSAGLGSTTNFNITSPMTWTYDTTDTVAQVQATNYFIAKQVDFRTGDAIYVTASDRSIWHVVTGVVPNVTIEPVIKPNNFRVPNTQIIVGNAEGYGNAVPLSGDAAIDNTGEITVSSAQGTQFNVEGTFITSGPAWITKDLQLLGYQQQYGPGEIPVEGKNFIGLVSTATGNAMTIPALSGLDPGQVLFIVYQGKDKAGDTVIVTPSNFQTGTSLTFTNIGDSAILAHGVSSLFGWYFMGGTATINP